MKLSERDFIDAAQELEVELPTIRAVDEVESRGEGFLPNGQPKHFSLLAGVDSRSWDSTIKTVASERCKSLSMQCTQGNVNSCWRLCS